MFASDSSNSYSKLHLTQGAGKKDRTIPCQVNHCAGKRLQIITGESVPTGTAVSVEHEDALLLGEVAMSKSQAHGWQVEIKIEHALNGLMNLMALRSRLLEESKVPAPEQTNR